MNKRSVWIHGKLSSSRESN